MDDLEKHVKALKALGNEPIDSYIAVAGRVYGYVNVWPFEEHEVIAEVYDGDFEYVVIPTTYKREDLLNMLLYINNKFLDPVDLLIHKANVTGELPKPNKDDTLFCVIRVGYHYGYTTFHPVYDAHGNIRIFDSLMDAELYADRLSSRGRNYLISDEAALPDYKVVSTD